MGERRGGRERPSVGQEEDKEDLSSFCFWRPLSTSGRKRMPPTADASKWGERSRGACLLILSEERPFPISEPAPEIGWFNIEGGTDVLKRKRPMVVGFTHPFFSLAEQPPLPSR